MDIRRIFRGWIMALCAAILLCATAFASNGVSIGPVVSAVPSELAAGTADPTITLASTVPFSAEAPQYLHVETKGTGLTFQSASVSGNSMTLAFQGTAEEGTITGFLSGGAFEVQQEPSSDNNATFVGVPNEDSGILISKPEITPTVPEQNTYALKPRAAGAHSSRAADVTVSFSVKIIPAANKAELCNIFLIAANGNGETHVEAVEIGQEYILPWYSFTLPDGKTEKDFLGWRICEQIYAPGERYIFDGDTAVTAVWKESKDGKADQEKEIEKVVSLIKAYVSKMTEEEKKDPDAIDLATLYAEFAAGQVLVEQVDGKQIDLSKAALAYLAERASTVYSAAADALADGGVTPVRALTRTVSFSSASSDLDIDIAADIVSAGVDKISVKAPGYEMAFKPEDLAPDLGNGMKVQTKNAGTSSEPKVKVKLTNDQTTNSARISFPSEGRDTAKHVVQSETSGTVVSKRNPFTERIEGKINTSDTYSRGTSQKDFSDIEKKSAEMQKAIRYLASMGVIDGTTKTTFSPDASISRAEIAKLLVVALGKLDSTATTDFKDVSKNNWYYAAAASSQRHGFVNGFEDHTFRGTNSISKVQIIAVSSRVLQKEMKYKTPTDPTVYLSKYSDSVDPWAQPEIALATRENLVVRRTDGTFSGSRKMSRGDAAVIIYRLFQRLW